MTPWTFLARRIPWTTIWAGAVWLTRRGRDQLEKNLDAGERRELADLMRESSGRPGSLSAKQRRRIRALVTQGVTGKPR